MDGTLPYSTAAVAGFFGKIFLDGGFLLAWPPHLKCRQ